MNRMELKKRIRENYQNSHLWVAAEDMDLFRLPLELRLGQWEQSQLLWIQTVEVASSAKKREESGPDDADNR